MVADPFHLLDCATTSEGGCGLVLTRADLAADAAAAARCTCSAATATAAAPSYKNPPTWELGGNRRARPRRTARSAGAPRRTRSAPPGSGPTDVDVCEFYDPFSFEIIRQFEAFGFCGEGEGGDFVTSGTIEPGGQYPVTTDGGADVVQPRRRDRCRCCSA